MIDHKDDCPRKWVLAGVAEMNLRTGDYVFVLPDAGRVINANETFNTQCKCLEIHREVYQPGDILSNGDFKVEILTRPFSFLHDIRMRYVVQDLFGKTVKICSIDELEELKYKKIEKQKSDEINPWTLPALISFFQEKLDNEKDIDMNQRWRNIIAYLEDLHESMDT